MGQGHTGQAHNRHMCHMTPWINKVKWVTWVNRAQMPRIGKINYYRPNAHAECTVKYNVSIILSKLILEEICIHTLDMQDFYEETAN